MMRIPFCVSLTIKASFSPEGEREGYKLKMVWRKKEKREEIMEKRKKKEEKLKRKREEKSWLCDELKDTCTSQQC